MARTLQGDDSTPEERKCLASNRILTRHSKVKASSQFAVNSSATFDDEFARIVRLGLGKNSLMIRKDRQGIAITKGSKRHKITFRDTIEPYNSQSIEPFAPTTLQPKTVAFPINQMEMNNSGKINNKLSVARSLDFEPISASPTVILDLEEGAHRRQPSDLLLNFPSKITEQREPLTLEVTNPYMIQAASLYDSNQIQLGPPLEASSRQQVAGPANETINDEQGGLQAAFQSESSASIVVVEEKNELCLQDSETIPTARVGKQVGNFQIESCISVESSVRNYV